MTASAAGAAALTHFEARQRWGEPDAWEGNVNDPRIREEHGIRHNEKWIYFLPDGGRRLVYWLRYQCRGAIREAPDGTLHPEGI